ncbi:TPA: hypothetical protein P9G65_005522 [Pseudomonas aeruginosa]|nr:hypothetical protein [Pseudomonas aeruginosa]HDQ4723234.1 hypothetical protein [Pseudomonas aeruginosa]
MKAKTKAQMVATAVLASALVGCFEPSGKNFEGAWIDAEKTDVIKPTLLDVSCDGGFCEVARTDWFFPDGKYASPSISNPKLENDNLLVWEGFGGSARIKEGKLYWNSEVYERRE